MRNEIRNDRIYVILIRRSSKEFGMQRIYDISQYEVWFRTGCLTRSTSAKYKVQKQIIYHLSFLKHKKK